MAALASSSLAFTSCDDMLDTKPQGVILSSQMGSEQAVEIMTAAYATLLCHYFGNNESFSGPITNWVFDLRSDDALKGGGGLSMEENLHQLEIGIIYSDNATIDFKWRNNYFSIARCNSAIKAISGSDAISENEKAPMIGEMKTLRAYYYFDMLRIFKQFPYFDETVANPSECRADQYTRDQIADFIRQDLADAYDVLPETQVQAGRFNKYVAAALLARVDLFISNWAEAATYAEYVINSGQYQLYPFFQDMSKSEYNNQYESVMAIQYSSANQPDQYNWCNMLNTTYSTGNVYGTGDDFYLGSQDLVNAFRTDNNGLPFLNGEYNDESVLEVSFGGSVDPRLDLTFGRIGMYWKSNLSDPAQTYVYDEGWCRALTTYSQYSSKKALEAPYAANVWLDVPWGQSPLNFCLIRYADVLLMAAEAYIEQGTNLETARQYINDVRAKAARSITDASYTPVDYNASIANYNVGQYPATGWNQEYARKAVRMERRLELAMEGLRWFDLVRWGTAVETVNNYYAFEQQYQVYYNGANLTADEIFFPIPLNQVENAGDLYK